MDTTEHHHTSGPRVDRRALLKFGGPASVAAAGGSGGRSPPRVDDRVRRSTLEGSRWNWRSPPLDISPAFVLTPVARKLSSSTRDSPPPAQGGSAMKKLKESMLLVLAKLRRVITRSR